MRFVDLFCGAGGMSEGLRQAGWECLLGVDHDPYALQVFAANHAAHRTLFQKVFPEFITGKNPVFFTGESYGGIYVPGFVDAMLDDPIPGLNFAGYAVGDGWTGCKPVAGRKAD